MKFICYILLFVPMCLAQERVVDVASTNYTRGTVTIGERAIPLGQPSIVLELSREAWPRGGFAALLECDLSLDGGTTWQTNFHTLSTVGGNLTNHFGVMRTNSLSIASMVEPSNPNRRIRVRFISETNLTTRIEVK